MPRTLVVSIVLSLAAGPAVADGPILKLAPPSPNGETYSDTQDFPFVTPRQPRRA